MSTVIPFDMYLPLLLVRSLFLYLSMCPLSKYPQHSHLFKLPFNKDAFLQFSMGFNNVLKEEYLENKHMIINIIWKFLKVQMQIT